MKIIENSNQVRKDIEETITGIEALSINNSADNSNNNDILNPDDTAGSDVEECYSEYSSESSDEESGNEHVHQSQTVQGYTSEEDWDSDSYWEPQYVHQHNRVVERPWLYYIKKKMSEGNFCPMDLHTVPIIEQVRNQRRLNPTNFPVVHGQFDNLSDDDS